MNSSPPLYSDDVVTVTAISGPDGQACVQYLGNQPAPPQFEGWAPVVRELAVSDHFAVIHYLDRSPQGQAVLVTDATGRTLAERLTEDGPLSPGQAVKMLTGVAAALKALHERGLHHGGVCPSTVVCEGDGTARLAGLDSSLPGLALSAPAQHFGPLDPQRSAAGDVYALAATGYVALGGSLPFASSPGSAQARSVPIADIPGCPAELTTLLRNALNPDPNARPSADTLHWDLGGISVADVPAPPTGSMSAETVAENVRPVNTPVAAINSAAAAAPVTGAPMSPGGYPAGPGSYPMPGTEPVTSVPSSGPMMPVPPPPAAKKTNNGLVIGIIAGVVVLLVAGVLGIVLIINNSGGSGGGGGGGNAADDSTSPTETNSDVENFDAYGSFPFYTLSKDLTPGKQVKLENGTYYMNSDHTEYIQSFGSPTYVDLNDDGALDAVLTLSFSGTSKASYRDAWYGVYAGLWDVKSRTLKPVKWQFNWQLSCVTSPNLQTKATGNNKGASVSFSSINSCDSSSGQTVTNTVFVNKSGLPVAKKDDITYATENCEAQENYGKSVSYKGKTPLVEPKKGSEKISGKYDKVTVWPKDQEGRGGYLLASVDWPGGTKGCGWVKKKDVKK